MPYGVFHSVIQDLEGNALYNASIEVRKESDNTLATIYSDKDGAALANPFQSDDNGQVTFYAADGTYKVTGIKGSTTRVLRDVPISAGAAAGDMLGSNNLSDVDSAIAAYDNIRTRGSNIASASTVNLQTATGDLVDVTGMTSITAITLPDGDERTVRFTGILTLTHSSNLDLPTSANITTAVGDTAIFRGYATGVVRCVLYQRKSGAALTAGGGGGDMLAANNLSDVASAIASYNNLTNNGTDVSSASTINLTSATGDMVDVTGTTTITAVTLADGDIRRVRFTGILTLTNGASLILPSGANITTAAGDVATFRGYGSSVVRCIDYQRVSGKAVVTSIAASDLATAPFGPFTTIASATTTDLSTLVTVGGSISGTTTITGFGTGANLLRMVKFAGALILTHNATSLILPGGANITTAAGDRIIALSDNSGNWTVVNYTKADGTPVSFNFGTSQAVILGSLELGHATQTTVTAPGAGRMAVEGAEVKLAGKTTVPVPSNFMSIGASGSAAAASIALAAGTDYLDVLDFDGAGAKEYAYFSIPLPKSYNGGTVTYRVRWCSSATDTDAAVFGLAAAAVSDNEALAVTYGTAIEVTDNAQSAANEQYTSAESAALTIGSTFTAGDLVRFRFYRDSANGSDTMVEDARVICVELFFSEDKANDA